MRNSHAAHIGDEELSRVRDEELSKILQKPVFKGCVAILWKTPLRCLKIIEK
jgi:hypothetical protein